MKQQNQNVLLKRIVREAKRREIATADNWLEQYACAVLKGEIIACLRIRQICAILLDKLWHPEKYAPWAFCEEEANRHIEFVETFCKQPQGKLGAPIKLELFQKARWQAIFGFVHQDTGLRQYNEVMILEGRKNGKTTECACLELDGLVNDREGAPEIYNVATKREQANKAYTACVQMVKMSPDLHVIRKRQSDLYLHLNMGFIMALASDHNGLDGLNAHLVVVDELHAIKRRSLYDDMKQSQSARAQPLLFVITTNGFVRENIFDSQYTYACGILDGTAKNEHFLPFLYELDEREEYKNEKMWIKANPGIDTIKSRDFLRQMVGKAKDDASFLPTVLVKDFNWKENAASAWLTWAEISNPATYDIKFDYAIGGFDAADSVDLNAATAICMRPGDPHIYRRSMYWIPQEVLDRDAREGNRRERDGVPYSLWVSRSLMRTCSGNKVDKAVILEWFKELRDEGELYVLYIGYDPWHIDDSLLRAFRQEFGERCMIPIRQGVKTLSMPMKDLRADLQAGNLIDNNNPIDKWCLANTDIRTDINGNIQPEKHCGESARRIDGTLALICAYTVLQDYKEEYINMNEGAESDGAV